MRTLQLEEPAHSTQIHSVGGTCDTHSTQIHSQRNRHRETGTEKQTHRDTHSNQIHSDALSTRVYTHTETLSTQIHAQRYTHTETDTGTEIEPGHCADTDG